MISTETKVSTQNLPTLLDKAKEQALSAASPKSRFTWLVIQAAIEAQLNRINEPNRVIIR